MYVFCFVHADIQIGGREDREQVREGTNESKRDRDRARGGEEESF